MFISCVRINEEKMDWDQPSLPVVCSFITPDSMISVLLTDIHNRTKEKNTYSNAEVYILDENKKQVLLTRLDSIIFADVNREMTISAGKTYQLKIDLKKDNTLITAYTTVPNVVANFEKYSIISTNEINEYQKSAYFSCQWKIPAENLITDDYFLISSWGWDLDIVKKNADTFTSITNRLLYPITDDNYSISLVTADKWLSRYLINENMQSNSLEMNIDLSSVIFPKFSGTLPDFSNIENGIGVFGSYLIHTRDLKGNIIR